MTADPYETTDLSATQPDTVKQLMARLAVYGASPDQTPPTLFYPLPGVTRLPGRRQGAPAPAATLGA